MLHDAARAAFRALHERGCFVLPNPWDVGSARWLAANGFQALASTSAGFAWTLGRKDGDISRDELLAHLRALCAATPLPVNADFESGFGDTADAIRESVTLAVETGVAGLSIEDRASDALFPLDVAVTRLAAARAAIDASGADVILVGRSEGFLLPNPDLADTVRRLRAYAAAGADCLYAPGLQTHADIAAVVAAVAPKPVNVLIMNPEMNVTDLAALGVRRVSVGGALALAAWSGFNQAARQLADTGTMPPRPKPPTFE